MSNKLYEEALADVRSLKDVAEDNAKRAVFEAVVPRIRDLIEKQLFNENAPLEMSNDELLGLAGGVDDQETDEDAVIDASSGTAVLDVDSTVGNTKAHVDGNADTSTVPPAVPPAPVGSPPPPVMGNSPEEGEVIDVAGSETVTPIDDDEEEYVLDLESLQHLVSATGKLTSVKELRESIKNFESRIKAISFLTSGRHRIDESKKNVYRDQFKRLSLQIQHTYDRVQESIVDPTQKKALNERLEKLNKRLNELKESKMRRLREADEDLDLGGADEGGDTSLDVGSKDGGSELKLTVKGLKLDPEELDNATVELETGDNDADDNDVDLDSVGGDDDGGDDLDLGGGGGEDEDKDDEVLEIDESMLRREINRMRKLREAKGVPVPSTKGNRPSKKTDADDFGDADVETDDILSKKIRESDGVDDEEDELDEMDDSCEATDHSNENEPSDKQNRMPENYRREQRLQQSLRTRLRRLQTEGMKCRGQRRQQYKEAWIKASKSLYESRSRAEKIQRRLNESKKNAIRQNAESRRPAGNTVAEGKLRKQLAEQNLLNAKLVYTNRLLQNESLTNRQKASIIERLDEVKTVREAKLVYESLLKTLTPRKSDRNLTESRVQGSGSRVERSGAPTPKLDESIETARWALLAGITK